MISENILNKLPEKYRAVIAAADDIHLALDAEWSINAMDKAYEDDNGLMRWKSNDHIVPKGETIEVWVLIGFITRATADKMAIAEKKDNEAFFKKNEKALKKYMNTMLKFADENDAEAFFS